MENNTNQPKSIFPDPFKPGVFNWRSCFPGDPERIDGNLERIAEYNANAPEVEDLLDLAKELGPIDGDNWGKLACRFSPVQRATATAYRLHI